ncbi:MAG TPA: Rid family hydrolase [Allosphingosinicella sp.]
MKSAIALLLALLPAAAAGQAPETRVLMSEDEGERRFQEQLGYADAIVAGDTVYLSGVVVGQRDGESLEAAYEGAYARIDAILKRAGTSWADVVDVTSFHTDVNAQIQAMSAVQKKYMAGHIPAWTAIDVDRLIPDRGITEIKIVARRPAAAGAR